MGPSDIKQARDAAQNFTALMSLLSVPEPALDDEAISKLVASWTVDELTLVLITGAAICTEILRSITKEPGDLTDALLRYVAKLALETA
jgi:hypothetical protein